MNTITTTLIHFRVEERDYPHVSRIVSAAGVFCAVRLAPGVDVLVQHPDDAQRLVEVFTGAQAMLAQEAKNDLLVTQ